MRLQCSRMHRIVQRGVAAAVAGLLALGVAAPASADEVADQLRQAEAAYAQKNFAAALTALTTAASLIRQMKAETWKAVLPDPPPGWAADEAKVVTVGPAVLGGGISLERRYRRGAETIEVSLIADSPMLQSVAVLLGAGMLVSGSELSIIDGQRVAYNASDNALQAIVADKVLVKVQGSKAVDKATLQAVFRAIKLRDIEKAAQ
jgi:hypothetical protein